MSARCSLETEPWWALAITRARSSVELVETPDWAMIWAGGPPAGRARRDQSWAAAAPPARWRSR